MRPTFTGFKGAKQPGDRWAWQDKDYTEKPKTEVKIDDVLKRLHLKTTKETK